MNIPYRLSTLVGRRNRSRFVRGFSQLPSIRPEGEVPATVYSFSGERDWPEQAASIRSFLRFVGRPERFVVVSDGTHTDESKGRLERIHPCVSLCGLGAVVKSRLSDRIEKYAADHFLGKKLALLVSLAVDGSTIYSDSDVLFFPGAGRLARLLQSPIQAPLYLLDSWPSLDARLIVSDSERESPVNGGFLVLNRALDWRDPLGRLDRMQGECAFFTEQTLVHLAMKAAGAQPLPSDRFILRAEDQFVYSDYYARRDIALRHYISSIRTKMWHHTALFC